ncbi:MAG TPA: glycosyltransferase 87 family protein [Chloroflexaceae bacterium]|nr:glycosyltransferase 87 family protein [Chloroflexaceae bacterium]
MPPLLNDWLSLMAALWHWFAGGNPYGAYPGLDGQVYAAGYYGYPPPTLILAAPLALLPWWLSGLLVQAGAIVGFDRWARRVTGRSQLAWLVLFPPLFQGLLIGQTTLLVLVALMFAELSYREGRDTRAGLLLALAILKPQVGILAIGYLLFEGLRAGRWRVPGAFALASALLWGGTALLAGPQIYAQWLDGLRAYSASLPDRPMVFLPLGPLVVLAAVTLWRRADGDTFTLALLLNTLIYPLSVLYIVSAVGFVVIRWRRDAQVWPLALCWLAPAVFARLPATLDMWIASIQVVVICALVVGLLPPLHWRAGQGQGSVAG